MTTLIVPGLHGSGPGHWQSWWLDVDPTSRLVEQDDWDCPDFDRWLARLENFVDQAYAPVLLAHSLGCNLVAHLATRRPDLPVRAALLVAPADTDDRDWAPCSLGRFSTAMVGRPSFPTMTVASRDDPYVRFERAEAFAQKLGSIFVDYGSNGHINIDSGFGPWPDGLHLLDRLLHAPRQRPALAVADAGTLSPPPSRPFRRTVNDRLPTS